LGQPDRHEIEIQPLLRDDGEPAFEEPWQAHVLAIASALAEGKAFTPGQWSEALGAELRRCASRGDPDSRETYYAAAVSALEKLLDRAGSVSREALDRRTEQWRRAYLHTPHGLPVELEAGKLRGA
jgi:nitrile hydratase accessory protein